MRCSQCGKKVKQGAVFCKYCGHNVEEQMKMLTSEQMDIKVSEKIRSMLAKNSKIILSFLILVVVGVGIYIGFLNKATIFSKSYDEEYVIDRLFILDYTESDSISYGDLYLNILGRSNELIAKDVRVDSYKIHPKTGTIVYLNKDSDLYILEQGKKANKVAEEVVWESVEFTETGKYVHFIQYKNIDTTIDSDYMEYSIGIYDIIQNEKHKLTDEEWSEYHFDEEGNLFYIDYENNLYLSKGFEEEERIARDVVLFSEIEKNKYIYVTEKNDKREYILYADNEEEEIEVDNIRGGSVESFQNGIITMFTTYEESSYEYFIGDLYIKLDSQEPIRLAKNVKDYKYSQELNTVYYIDDTETLYTIELPRINNKMLRNFSYAEDILKNVEKERLERNVDHFDMSADGRNILIYDEDEIILLRNKQKLKIADYVKKADIFNEYLIYVTDEDALYIQEGIQVNDISKVKEEPILLTENLYGLYSTTEFGKYVNYIEKTEEVDKDTEEQVVLAQYVKDKGKVVLLEDVNQYDSIKVDNDLTYTRTLLYKEVVGFYKSVDLGEDVLIQIDENRKIKIYFEGELEELEIEDVETIEREEIQFVLEKDSEEKISFRKNLNETYRVDSYAYGGYSEGFSLEILDEEKFNDEIERQKKEKEERLRKEEEERLRIEEERKKEEAERLRRDNLMNEARSYYSDGVFLSSGTEVYTSVGYQSSAGKSTISDENWTVYDYDIDYEQSIIWLKIRDGSSSNSYYSYNYNYYWVPIAMYN